MRPALLNVVTLGLACLPLSYGCSGGGTSKTFAAGKNPDTSLGTSSNATAANPVLDNTNNAAPPSGTTNQGTLNNVVNAGNADASPAPSPAPTTSPADQMKYCNNKGLVWIAVVNGTTSPSTCGEPLADSSFPCSTAGVLAKYPAFAAQLNAQFANLQNSQLYNCGKQDANTYILHFLQESADGSMKYNWVSITSGS